MLPLLKDIYTSIQNIGIHPDLEESEFKYIKMHNGLLAVSALLLSPFPIIFLRMNSMHGIFLCIFGLAIVTIPLYINHLRLYFISRVVSMIASLAIFLLGLKIYGLNSGFEYGIPAVMVLPLLYFRRTRIRTFFYIFLFFILVVSYQIMVANEVYQVPTEELLFLRHYMFFSCLFLITFYFISWDNINKEYQKKNEELVASLTQKNRDLERFSYSVSHDLKEPLRTISSFTQLLKRDMGQQLTPDSKEYYDYIIRGTKQMSTLLDDVLRYSKVDNLEFELETLDLNDVLENALDQFSSNRLGRDADIEIFKLPNVKGTNVFLNQLFQNIISNAIKFKDENQSLKLEIWSEKDENFNHIHIKDYGIGIEEKYQKKIFNIFERLHPRFTYSGSGIGLGTCQLIMEKLEGEISVKSELGKGATFILSFPLVTTDPVKTKGNKLLNDLVLEAARFN